MAETKKVGEGVIIFAVAPLYGLCDFAKQQFTQHTVEVAQEGARNACTTAAVVGVGEACPPLGLGIAAGGVLALGYDQVFSSTSQARNAKLLAIAGSLGCNDNGSMSKKFSWVHDVMGPDLFHGSYAMATGGLGVKPGRAIGVELNASISMRNLAETAMANTLNSLSQFGRELSALRFGPPLSAADGVPAEIVEFEPLKMAGESNRGARGAKPTEREAAIDRAAESYGRSIAVRSWSAVNEEISQDVVVQKTNNSCIAACGEMLSKGELNQNSLIEKYPVKTSIENLAQELGRNWSGGWIESAANLDVMLKKSPFAVELALSEGGYHVVIVDGISKSGAIEIRDPWIGSKYQVERQDFLKAWRFGGIVFNNSNTGQ